MAYLPKSLVEKNIKTRVRKDRRGNEHTDYEAYIGIDPFSGRPVRITRSSEKELSKALSDWYARHKTGGDAAVRLTAVQAIDAKNAYDALASAGMADKSLYDVIVAYIGGRGNESANHSVTVAEACKEFFSKKFPKTKGVPSVNEQVSKYSIARWADTCGDTKLVEVTARSVAEYLADNYSKRKPKTYNHHLLYLKTFFNWCCKDEQSYLVKSPIRSLEYRPEPWEEPEYMQPKDVERLFRLLESRKEEHPEHLAYAVVSFFCGCRAIEIQRMANDPDAAKINIEGETVRIAKAKGYQQGKRPRAFHVHPTALAWMKSFDFLDAVKKIKAPEPRVKGTQVELYELARGAGIPVFQNCGRHTFITYHVAAYGEPEKTQAMVGTSEKMRAENYCGLAIKADGEAFFKILPSV